MRNLGVNHVFVFFVTLWTFVALSVITMSWLFKERAVNDLMLHEAKTITRANTAFAFFVDSLNTKKNTMLPDSLADTTLESEIVGNQMVLAFKKSINRFNKKLKRSSGVEAKIIDLYVDSIKNIVDETERDALSSIVGGSREYSWMVKKNHEKTLVFLRSLEDNELVEGDKIRLLKIIVPDKNVSKDEDRFFGQIAMVVLLIWMVGCIILSWLRSRFYRILKSLYMSDKALVEVQQLGKLCSWEVVNGDPKVYYTLGLCDMLCVEKESLPSTFIGYSQYVHPEDRTAYLNFTEKTMQPFSGKSPEITYRLQIENDFVKYIKEYREIEFDRDGEPFRARGIIQDITTEWIIEEKMREARQIYQNILMPIFILSSKTGKILVTNDTFGDYFGDHLDKTCLGTFACDEEHCKDCPLNAVSKRRSGQWEMHLKPSNQWFICSYKTIKWSDGSDVFLVVMNDVTTVKLAEHELAQNEYRFRSLFESSIICQFITSGKDLLILTANESCLNLLGHSEQDIVGTSIRSFVVDVSCLEFDEITATYEPFTNVEVEIVTKAGDRKVCLLSMSPFVFKGEESYLFELLDVTEYKKIEAELLQARILLHGE